MADQRAIVQIARALKVPMALVGIATPPFKRSKRQYPQRRKFRTAVPSGGNHWADWMYGERGALNTRA